MADDIANAYDLRRNLTGVSLPDSRTRSYRYNEPGSVNTRSLPNALTGVIDETSARSASYWYDEFGRAVRESRWRDLGQAQGVDAYILQYSTNQTKVTDSLTTDRQYQFTSLFDSLRVTSQSQPGGSGCGPSSSALTYDANANVAFLAPTSSTKTCYAYDLARNLETKRVEGVAGSGHCPLP